MAVNNYVGKGLVFPIELDSNGRPILSTGFDLINSSIKIILTWSSSRIMLSEFRSLIDDLLEEPNDDLLKGLVEFYIYDNLRRWEKRIDILETSIQITEYQRMDASIKYRINNSNLEEVFTFPFYRKITY